MCSISPCVVGTSAKHTHTAGPSSKPIISEEALEELEANRVASPTTLPPSLLKDIESGAKRSASALALSAMSRSRNASLAAGLADLASANGTAHANGNGAVDGDAVAVATAGKDDSAAESASTPGSSPKKQQLVGGSYRLTNSSPKGTPAAVPGTGPEAAASVRRCGLLAFCCTCMRLRPAGCGGVARVADSSGALPPPVCLSCSKMPFEPLTVTFKDVCYDVPRPKSTTGEVVADPEVDAGTLRLLRHIDGAFRPGVLTALMVRAGVAAASGRTSLLLLMWLWPHVAAALLNVSDPLDLTACLRCVCAVPCPSRAGRIGRGQDDADGRAGGPQDGGHRQRGGARQRLPQEPAHLCARDGLRGAGGVCSCCRQQCAVCVRSLDSNCLRLHR